MDEIIMRKPHCNSFVYDKMAVLPEKVCGLGMNLNLLSLKVKE
jgi:hypothetical protein